MRLGVWPFLLAALFAKGTHAQSKRTVLDGVFTEAQANRGMEAYSANCAECHEGADVDGPPLEGSPFVDRWREDNLNVLFTFIKTSMPANKPGSLSTETYLDIYSDLLKMNGYPAGKNELTAPVLLTTRLVGKDGPQPLPTNALVQVVGCLASSPDEGSSLDEGWVLLQAAEAARTQSADQITPEEIKASEAQSPGTLSFNLRNLPEVSAFVPNSHVGQKIIAKGVLTHQAKRDRINVTAVREVASNCVPH